MKKAKGLKSKDKQAIMMKDEELKELIAFSFTILVVSYIAKLNIFYVSIGLAIVFLFTYYQREIKELLFK